MLNRLFSSLGTKFCRSWWLQWPMHSCLILHSSILQGNSHPRTVNVRAHLSKWDTCDRPCGSRTLPKSCPSPLLPIPLCSFYLIILPSTSHLLYLRTFLNKPPWRKVQNLFHRELTVFGPSSVPRRYPLIISRWMPLQLAGPPDIIHGINSSWWVGSVEWIVFLHHELELCIGGKE